MMLTRLIAKDEVKQGRTEKPAGNAKWQIGKLSVSGGAISFGLAFLIMVLLGKTAKRNPKARLAPLMYMAMVAFGILGFVLIMGGLIFLALGSGKPKTGAFQIDTKPPVAYRIIVERN